MTSYGDVPHGFTVFGTPAYRQEADKQSWKRFLNFLNEIFS
jgi:dienelactone hydrolase